MVKYEYVKNKGVCKANAMSGTKHLTEDLNSIFIPQSKNDLAPYTKILPFKSDQSNITACS